MNKTYHTKYDNLVGSAFTKRRRFEYTTELDGC